MLTCGNCGRASTEDLAFCPACGSRLDGPRTVRDVRKVVSVVFCDISGSTALGERLDPEALRHVMSRYFDLMKAVVERHGGTVEKFIGDAVMAVFGLPTVHEDDALRAVRAASDMREALASLNGELGRDHGESLQVRIGVNTGAVLASDPSAGDTLVTGDAVNVAARLEQAARPSEIVIGAKTLELVRDAVLVAALEPLEAKGKADPLQAYRLVDFVDGASAVTRRRDSPLVGREGQLAALRRAFDATVDHRNCRLVTILGAPGVGKSRLSEEFLENLPDDAMVLRGRCLPYGDGITYLPVVEVVKQAARIADEDPPDVVNNKIRIVFTGDEYEDVASRCVAQLLGVGASPSGEESFWAIRRFLLAVAGERPLALVFDDIQWGDPSFLDLVEHVAVWSRGAPILLLCMARIDLLDRRPAWAAAGLLDATTIQLEPLSDDETADLVVNLLEGSELPPSVIHPILATAEGNPLFAEQVIAALIDDATLIREGAGWRLSRDIDPLAVPPTIQTLLAARIERLTRDERGVLEAASVVGKRFSLGALRYLLPVDLPTLLIPSVMALLRKEFVRPDRTSSGAEDEYVFSHQTIRDAAYGMIPKATRAGLHEKYADWLGASAGERIAEQDEILGYHLEQACGYWLELGGSDERLVDLARRAAEHLSAAGRRAAERGNHLGAETLLRRAAHLLPPNDLARPAILYDLGVAQIQIGELPDAFQTFGEAGRMASGIGDRSLEWRARIRRSSVQTSVDPRGKPTEEFKDELEQAVRLFEEVVDEVGLATAWAELGWLEWSPLRYTSARRALERAVAHARRAGDRSLVSEALMLLLAAHMHGDTKPAEGMRALQEASEELQGDLRGLGIHAVIEAAFRSMNGEFDEARSLFARAGEMFDELGHPYLQRHVTEQLGFTELAAGNPAAAEQAFREQMQVTEAMGDRSRQSTAAGSLATALCELGRFDEAEHFAAVAREMAADDDLVSQITGRQIQAKIAASHGEYDAAERLALEAVEMLAGVECPGFEADALLTLAAVLRSAGKVGDATAAAVTALELRKRKGDVPGAARIRVFLKTVGVGHE